MALLTDKVAFITGAASGIGAACARVLAGEGAAVVITDIDATRGKALEAEITSAGGRAVFMVQDVADEDGWKHCVDETMRQFGRLDVAVANAGIAIFGPVLDMTLADWRRQNAVNLDGVFLTAKYCIPAMRKGARGGSLVMISSVAGLRGSGLLAGYSASKGAVRLFAKSMAMECAAAGDSIRVNSVHPGIILTPIWEKAATPGGGGLNAPLNPYDLASAGVPLGKPADPTEIANGVLFLASDLSTHMTGAELVIDGGMTAGTVRRR
ncbi:MAG: glucose 1-dehydrogenase [Acetobacteraceae bacterium]|nr:glucose 1-dehydrogenase [Acetobacteraceae bacterium]